MLGVTAGCAALFLLLIARIALLLGATPVGSMTEEIVYLRMDLFRPLLRAGLAFLVLEAAQFLLPVLVQVRAMGSDAAQTVSVIADLAQALLLLGLALGLLLVFQRYSRRSLERLEELPRRALETVASKKKRERPPTRVPR